MDSFCVVGSNKNIYIKFLYVYIIYLHYLYCILGLFVIVKDDAII